MSGPPANFTRSHSNEGRTQPGDSIRQSLWQAHVRLQRIGVLSLTTPGDDNDDQFPLDADPPQFNLFGESDQDEDSDTVSEGPAKGYEDFDNAAGHGSASAHNTFQENYVQAPDPVKMYREEVSNLGLVNLQ